MQEIDVAEPIAVGGQYFWNSHLGIAPKRVFDIDCEFRMADMVKPGRAKYKGQGCDFSS
jgi:hypothetical protein